MRLRSIIICFMALAFVSSGLLTPDYADAARKKKTKAELNAAKKSGDLSESQAEKFRNAYGAEADEANIESFETKTKKTGLGNSTYGVVGFDYLTGIGKVASDPSQINEKTFKLKSANKSPLEGLMKKRFKHKWTGQYNDTESGWTGKTGVTEVWFRKHDSGSKLGADYNAWVNQWNNLTRPGHKKGEKGAFTTPVAGADPDQGAHWFSFYCVHCHGWTGKGDGPTAAMLDPRPRNLTNGKYTNFVSNVDIFTMIKGGGLARNLSQAMPPWGNVLQDQDIWNVVAFIRTLADKPKYVPDPSDVTAANAKKSQEFQDMNEELELPGVMAGRGVNKGGYNSVGGGRLASEKTGVSVKETSGENPCARQGDYGETRQYDK